MATGKTLVSKAFDRLIRRDPARLTARLLKACADAKPENEDALCRTISDLVAAGADIHARDNQGRTVLSLLVCNGRIKALSSAITAGADVNRQDRGDNWTPLLWAATNADVEMLQLLLAHNADPKHRTNDGWGAIDAATKNDTGSRGTEAECLKILLAQGLSLGVTQERKIYFKKRYLAPAVPEIQNAIDLRAACDKGDKAAISEVLARGTHPDASVKYGDNTPLIYLSSKNDVEGMKMLIKAGADVNLVSPLVRKTPLLNAATHGCKEACRLLIESGADETIEFRIGAGRGSTAVDFARQTPGLAEYIEELVAERAYARSHPAPPDITLPEAITVSKPLQLKRRAR